MCDSRLSPMGWLSFSACPLPKCPIERGKDNRPTLGGTMSVLALSLGLSTVLILTALHIASYMHIHTRGHTHILTTIHNCIRRSSCKGESCHKCHELQLPKDQHPIPKPRRLDQILSRESNPGHCGQIRVLYQLRHRPAHLTTWCTK